MRLTLRTLLAYLDGILEPKDAEDLGKKVEESEYATGLVHRVRDVMRRLRLGAPSLTDRGPGLDPNTVAEYLDNTLAADRVTDFEKVCLDSDTHLAEVASCHQILTLVLGEPAEVDPTSRQRMYEVEDVHGGAKPPPTPPTGSAAPTAPTAPPPLSLDLDLGDSADRKPRPKPTVPEYLREPRRRRAWLASAAAVLLAVCVLGVALKLCGQFEPGTPGGNILAELGIGEAEPEVADRGAGKEEKGAEESGKGETAPVNGSAAEVGKEPSATSGTATTQASPAAKPDKKSTVEPGAAVVKETKPPKPDGGATTEVKPPPAVGPKPPKPADGSPVAPVPNPVIDGGQQPAPMPPAAPEPLGRFLSDEQKVLLSDNPPNGWTRVAANQTLIPQHVLALPTYRPKIVLTPDVTVEILGGTRVELLGSNAKELPGIRVMFGQVVLMPVAKGGTRLRVAFGDHRGTITFVDADSVAALEVHHLHAPGTNPETEPPHVTADLFATGGAVSWEETVDGKAGQPQQLAPSERLGFDAQLTGTPIAAKEVPPWIAAGASIKASMSAKALLDRRASPAIAQSLPTDQPARIGLLQLVTSRPQKEVRWLSLRCLGYVGQFRDMVAALNDPAHKNDWPDYIDALRAAVDRDSETAAAVHTALEKQYPQQAGELYRMLWGYTDNQLEFGYDGKGGEDAKLVQGLKNDDVLAVRVLAIWNLKDITRLASPYPPEQPPARRQQSVRRWERRLAAKEIRLAAAEKKAAARENVVAPALDGRQ